MPYERPNIHDLHAYVPGEQPRSGEVVKLNTNENPYPPPSEVLEAVRAVEAEMLRRYPPPLAPPFREAAARLHGLTPDHVIATNGGDELLRLAITVFCRPVPREHAAATIRSPGPPPAPCPGGLAQTDPTYSLYDVLADIHDTPVTRIGLNEDWSIPEDFADRVIDAQAALAIVVNPHAPSGRLESVQTLDRLARRLRGHAVLMIDEAYVDFARQDALPLLDDRRGLDNVLLLRSLSKGYALAGVRFGYGLGSPGLIAALDKARDSYNTDVLSQAAALAALRHRDAARESWRKVIAERDRLAAALVDRGFHVAPSESNFLLVTPPPTSTCPSTAAWLYHALHDRRIYVRYFEADRLRDKLRITVGTRPQNDALLAALAKLLP